MRPKKLSPAPILGSIHGQRAMGRDRKHFLEKIMSTYASEKVAYSDF